MKVLVTAVQLHWQTQVWITKNPLLHSAHHVVGTLLQYGVAGCPMHMECVGCMRTGACAQVHVMEGG